MELVPLIQLALYIFSGILALVMIISYISYKINNKNKLSLAEQSVVPAAKAYRPQAQVRQIPVMKMPAPVYQVPQMPHVAQYHHEYAERPVSVRPVENYKKQFENKRVMIVNKNYSGMTQNEIYSQQTSSFDQTNLRAAVSFR